MADSKLPRPVSHAQAMRMKAKLAHAIAMIRADLEKEPEVDPRGVEAELVMLLVRQAATVAGDRGMDLTAGAAVTIARLEAELERAKIRTAAVFSPEEEAVRMIRAANGHAVAFADGSHNGTATVDAFARAERSYARHTHPSACGCSLCEGAGA